jgi:hypothetical protein
MGEESERHLRLNKIVYGSDDLKALQEDPEDASIISDFALLAKIPNPFNREATVLVVAGLHWLGTRGAAEFLAKWTQWNAEDLEQQVGDDYFAVVIYVEGKGTEEQLYFTKVQTVEGSLWKSAAPSAPLAE